MSRPLYNIESLYPDGKWKVFGCWYFLQKSYAQGAFNMLKGLNGGSKAYRLVKLTDDAVEVIEVHHTGSICLNEAEQKERS